MILAILLTVLSLGILIAELWLGIAVTGWQGDELYIERAKSPGPYWMTMVLHMVIGIGLPVLAFIAGI